MIAFDFEYYEPVSVQEAVEIFHTAEHGGKKAVFYSGGTEFITFARTNKMHADVVIDIKGVPECQTLETDGKMLTIGAAVSLTTLVESKVFPLLSKTVKGIADHTSRSKITIGGNLNSRFIYREGLLPFLLVDAKGRIVGKNKDEMLSMTQIFLEGLNEGELLVQIEVDESYVHLPFSSIKKTRMSKVSYPVVTVAALVKDQKIRTAFSGVCEFPFRSIEIEKVLNDFSLTKEERIDQVIEMLPGPVVEDMYASLEYRKFVFKNVLEDTLESLEEKV